MSQLKIKPLQFEGDGLSELESSDDGDMEEMEEEKGVERVRSMNTMTMSES